MAKIEREATPLPRVLDKEPKELPELRHKYVSWLRTSAPEQWSKQHYSGTQYVPPPELDAKNPHDPDFGKLTEFYAETWERGKLYFVTEEMTTLAYRTQMDEYRLTLENLPSPRGIIFWKKPIGVAEQSSSYTIPVDMVTGEMDTTAISETLAAFDEAPSPIVAASWRYDPENNLVWVAYHSDHAKFMSQIMAEWSPEERAFATPHIAPIGFEREQALPLDVTLAWPNAEGDKDRLPVTARSIAADIGPTEEIRAKGRQRNDEALEPTTQWIRTLIASWMLMKWKIAQHDEEQLPRPARKRLTREDGVDRNLVEATSKIQIIRLGAPIKHRASKGEPGKGGKWKVRAIIGPYIRNRQYIPAHDRYDDTPRLIEPYIAGPEGAPISNADKVFLLGND